MSNEKDSQVSGSPAEFAVPTTLRETARAQQKIEHELTRWQAIKLYPRTALWILSVVWVLILVGYENQAGSIVISIPQFREDFGKPFEGGYVLDSQWQSAISGGPQGSVAVGSVIGSWFVDRLGRKWTMLFAVLLTVPFVTIEFISTSIDVFFVGKFLNGFCLGALSTVATTYVSEVSPMALRGIAAASCSLAFCIGPFICYLINNTTSTYTSRMAYRGVFIPQWVFAAISLCYLPFLPESPYYLILKGKEDGALKSLKKLYGDADLVQNQFAVMKVTVEESKLVSSKSGTYLDCFKVKDIKRTFIITFAFFMQSMSGVSFVAGYSTYYYQLAGFSTQRSYQISCGAQALSISGVIASWFIIDRFGRRPLMLWGMLALTVLNLIVACTGLETSNHASMTVASAFIAMYNFFYNINIGPLPYILASEISSVFLRAKTMATATTVNYAMQCMWSFVLPYMFNPDQANMGSKINFIFTGCSLFSIGVFFIYLPETAGRSFEEIDEMYKMSVPPRKWKGYKTSIQHESEEIFHEMEENKNVAEHVERV